MITLLLTYLAFGLLAGAVMVAVGLLYRGRHVPRAQRMTDVVVAAAQRVHPGEAPPQGVLTIPERSRQVSARFESLEGKVQRGARMLRR